MFKSCYYEKVERSDHILVQLEGKVDFGFVRRLCPPTEAETGRPAWDPLVLFKITLLQFLYNLSDRQVMGEVDFHLAFKWFVGLDVHEDPPCYSKLSQFRATLGEQELARLHNEVVSQCRKKGLVANHLTIIDATQVRAKVDHWKKIDNEEDCSDKDARFGQPDPKTGIQHKGYKAHLAIDEQSDIITKFTTSPANEHDSQHYESLLPEEPPMITADKAYDSNEHRIKTEGRGHHYAVIPKGSRSKSAKEKLKHYTRREQAAMKRRRVIEKKIAEMKERHGFRVCRYWGKVKFYLQTTFTVLVVNLKRMLKLLILRETSAQF